jgi:pilus assembly protein Flp/PilA
MVLTLRSVGDRLLRVRAEEAGQGLTEYALILALIAVVAVVALAFFGSQVTTELNMVQTAV